MTLGMTDFWELTARISEAPDDQFTLRQHLLDAHAGDPELIPSTTDLQGLQQLHIKLHANGANHSHYGISNGTGVQPFGDGVKSSGYFESWRCRRCGNLFGRAEYGSDSYFDRAADEGRLCCRSCLEDARIR